MTYEITAQPTAEPLTLDEVKTFLNLTSNDHDAMLDLFIRMAREWAEKTTGRAMLSQTIKQYWDEWPTGIFGETWELGIAPVTSVTSIQYLDSAGATQTWATTNYTADVKSRPARIVPTDAVEYPELDDAPNAVIVTYVAGVSSVASVPATARAAMMQKIAFLYENREDIKINGVGSGYMVRSADALIFNERIHLI